MAFVLDKRPDYFWPVTYQAARDGGKFDTFTFDIQFARLPQSRIRELLDAGSKGEVDDRAVCKEVVVGWNGVTDGKGEDIPFSQGNLIELLEFAGMESTIIKAFFESLEKAAAKN